MLKQAIRKFNKGEYGEAETTLNACFNTHSLRKKFDPNYVKEMMQKDKNFGKKLIMEESILK